MSRRNRVLTVDDSELVQAILHSILSTDRELELVGTARNGHEAFELTAKLRPDVIVMDIDMPELGGLGATEKIMAYHPTPILVLTSLDRGDVAFEALSRGALEVVEKPELNDERCRELIAKIKLCAGIEVVTHLAGRRSGGERAGAGQPQPLPGGDPGSGACGQPPVGGASRTTVIGIGSSTGGPKALGQICGALPADFPASILVVQHIAEGFVPVLTSWLDGSSSIRVKEAEHGESLEPGVAYIAPSHLHMELVGRRIVLSDEPLVEGHRPAADVLLSSIARSCGRHGMGIVLSGMGSDGARGARQIREAGGYAVAQSEETCVVFGMPKAAVELDGVNRVLDPQGIAAAVLRRAQEGERS